MSVTTNNNFQDIIGSLVEIISRTNKVPTIVNDTSNFVVVTYWWGRSNLNQNTARPCIAFYEDVIKKTQKYFINMINTITKDFKNTSADKDKIPGIIKNIFKSYSEDKRTFPYIQIISKTASSYMNSIYEYCNIDNRLPENEKNEKALEILERYKKIGKTPQNFEFKNKEYVENILFLIVKYAMLINETEIIQLYIINDQIIELQKNYSEIKSQGQMQNLNNNDINELKLEIKELQDKKNDINNKIKANLRIKKNHDESSGFSDPIYNNTNIFDIFNMELRYLNPLKFEEMIGQWEDACRNMNCNFLSVEYPEFAQPGGYQLAINAKPLFIKKALELCNSRGALYIDGDMYIRKYPMIFDLRDVDFMARGWWIDPRSSWKMNESIMYDPYTFETSGGTMFFTQSHESKMLLQKWIDESSKPYNNGKADDRILSLVFNTNKFLCNMKIIQLPIEYLWLSLDYDERLMDELYDYDEVRMRETIFIEHPECLTSEDTAAGAGASSDRTPKFYSFLENLVPVSELMHEYIFFPDKQMTTAFESYFDYMKKITYLDDGNEELVKKGFVDKLNHGNNEQPITIIDYDEKYGTKKYINDPEVTINQVAEINLSRAQNMNTAGLNLITVENNVIEIQNADNSINEAKMIALIIKLLQQGNYVIYNPINSQGYNAIYYDTLKSKMNLYKSLEFVFVPEITSYDFTDFFRPKIKTNMPMFFSPSNEILIKFLSMFLSLNDLSDYINYGSYELMSRIRVGYLFPPKNRQPGVGVGVGAVVGGGDGNGNGNGNEIDEYINEYENGLEEMYGNKMTGGIKMIHKKTYKKRKFKNKNKSRRRR
jgi:hypothetical protein